MSPAVRLLGLALSSGTCTVNRETINDKADSSTLTSLSQDIPSASKKDATRASRGKCSYPW